MGKVKDSIYNILVRKNRNVCYEYERYVMEHTLEHYEHRFIHWKILWKLNKHYRILKKTEPLLYWDKNNIVEDNKVGTESKEGVHQKNSVQNNEKNIINVVDSPLSKSYYRLEPFFFAKKLLGYDVISFDIFDTLLFRAVCSPKDVFMLMGEKLQIREFPEIRIQAEKKLRERKRAFWGNHEVTLGEIYSEIESIVGVDKEKLKRLEIDTELKLIYPNPYMKQVFDILKNQGKTIIGVSDMYLSSNDIKRLLKKCGYEIDNLFVSCEYSCNKRQGGLYRQVLNKFQRKKIVHIGDNYAVDVEKAKKIDIQTEFYRSCRNVGKERFWVEGMSEAVGSVYFGLVNNTLFNGRDEFNPFFEYGYVYGGIYVLGFCYWIARQAQHDGVTKILFLSRDGEIYQKIFHMLNTGIDIEYVYWSRIASTIFNMKENKYDFIQRLVHHKAVSIIPTKIGDILRNIHVSEEDIELKRYGLHKDMVLCEENKFLFEKALLEKFDIIERNNNKRVIMMEDMLKKAIHGHKKVAIVDVGWTGTSILSIRENLLKTGCEIYGYLAGSKVKDDFCGFSDLEKGVLKVYMFSRLNNRFLYDYHRKANKGTNSIYFELFTQACMPSFRGLTDEGHMEFDIPEVENYEMIDEIHRGIKYFARQYMHVADEFPILKNISGSDAYLPFQKISSNLEYIRKYFSDFCYARGVGGSGEMRIETIGEIISHCGLQPEREEII